MIIDSDKWFEWIKNGVEALWQSGQLWLDFIVSQWFVGLPNSLGLLA